MRNIKAITAGLGLALGLAAPAAAWEAANTGMPIYQYNASANYCPGGTQPVVVGGVICCGNPTTSMSYQSMMTHPAPRRVVAAAAPAPARVVCPVGQKGCYRQY